MSTFLNIENRGKLRIVEIENRGKLRNVAAPPVLIDLHGGGFMSGSSMNNNGAHLASKHQMVVVHANYRLAEFGYWYSDSEPESANAGFLDQQLAIEWVKKSKIIFTKW